jgi:hypothetical protein
MDFDLWTNLLRFASLTKGSWALLNPLLLSPLGLRVGLPAVEESPQTQPRAPVVLAVPQPALLPIFLIEVRDPATSIVLLQI